MDRTIVKIGLVYLFTGIIIHIALNIGSKFFIEHSAVYYTVRLSLNSILSSLIAIWYGMRKINLNCSDLFKTRTGVNSITLSAISYIAITALIFISLSIVSTLNIENNKQDELLNNFYYSPIGIISGIVIFPILEEILSKGIFLNLLLKEYSVGRSIIIVSVFFGIMHLGTGSYTPIHTTILSIIISYLYISTKSVLPCIALHMFNNGFAYILDYIDREYYAISPSIGWFFIPVLIISIYYMRKNYSQRLIGKSE